MRKINYLITAFIIYSTAVSAQWSIDSLSAPYSGLATTKNGSKAIFASSTKYETYDFVTGAWTTHNMLQPRANVKATTANGKSYFAGGGFIGVSSYAFYKNVDIYNASSDTWTIANLSNARIVGASASIGNKVLFAGGRQILNYSNRVDIFNVTTGVRTTYNLSQGRHNMAVAVVGSKVIFAGGECGNISMGTYTSSNKVDIYDNATGTWSTALLSAKREQIAVAVVGTKVLFAGGITPSGLYSNRIDIYDASTNTWSTKNMSETKYGIATATSGNKVYLAGGMKNNSGVLSNRVEIYNATTNAISYVTLSSPRMSMAAAKTPQRIMFAGGIVVWGNTGTDRIEVLDLATNTWSVEYLSRPRLNLASVSYNDKAMFAGGAEVLSAYPQYSIISNRVDIWTDVVLKQQSSDFNSNSPAEKTISIFPNPAQGNFIHVDLNQFKNETVEIKIFNLIGEMILNKTINGVQNSVEQINISKLKTGMYILKAEGMNQAISIAFIVQH